MSGAAAAIGFWFGFGFAMGHSPTMKDLVLLLFIAGPLLIAFAVIATKR